MNSLRHCAGVRRAAEHHTVMDGIEREKGMSEEAQIYDAKNDRWLEYERRLLDDFWEVKTSELMYQKASAWAAFIARKDDQMTALRAEAERLRGEVQNMRELIWALLWSTPTHKISIPEYVGVICNDPRNEIVKDEQTELFVATYEARRK